MAYRQLMIMKKCHLSVDNKNIKISHDDTFNLVPAEDVSIIIIDNQEVTYTTPFMNICAENGIALLICGKQHLPDYQCQSINNHYRQYEVLKMQIEQPDYLKEPI